jgi:hypothetical protein
LRRKRIVGGFAFKKSRVGPRQALELPTQGGLKGIV